MGAVNSDFRWIPSAQHAYDEYLSKDYTRTDACNDDVEHKGVDSDGEDVTVPRPNHGLLNAMQKVACVKDVAIAYAKHKKLIPFTDREIEELQLVALFLVVGRENELGHSDEDPLQAAFYKSFREKSAEAFVKHVMEDLPSRFDDDEIEFYKNIILNPREKENDYASILRICHDLDLLRCIPADLYKKKITRLKDELGDAATTIAAKVRKCTKATGGRIFGERGYQDPAFTSCSTDVVKCIEKISTVFSFHVPKEAFPNPPHPEPIPSNLSSYLQDSSQPWELSDDVDGRLEPSKKRSYKRCTLDDADPEWEFVMRYYLQHQPEGYRVRKIKCFVNDTLQESFKFGLQTMHNRTLLSAFEPGKFQDEQKNQRNKALSRFKHLTRHFSYPTIKGKLLEGVDVVPLWSGTSKEKSRSVFDTGFTCFGKNPQGPDRYTDEGYFGKGIYLTDSAKYAAMYAETNGKILLSFASMRTPYPIVSDVPIPYVSKDMKQFKGQHVADNYDAHFIPVRPVSNKKDEKDYYPCHKNEQPFYDEFCLSQDNQVLPAFSVKLEKIPAKVLAKEKKAYEECIAEWGELEIAEDDSLFDSVLEKANEDDPWAQTNIGLCYLHGVTVDEDNELAVEWLEKAYLQENPLAAYNLGRCYAHGWGVKKNMKTANSLYLFAAERGVKEAKQKLGIPV